MISDFLYPLYGVENGPPQRGGVLGNVAESRGFALQPLAQFVTSGLSQSPLDRMHPLTSPLSRAAGLAVLLAATGCAHFPMSYPAAQRRASERTIEAAEDGLVFFKVEQAAAEGRDRRPGTATFSGIVLTPEGHLLAPFVIKPDTPDRIEAYIGEQRYLARPLKPDESLGMTVLKIEPSSPLVPLNLNRLDSLRIGEPAFTLVGSDEDSEFARFVFPSTCQGIIEGFYRQYSLSPIPNSTRGAPLFNAQGGLVGLVTQSNAWMLSDLREDIGVLLAEALGRGDGGKMGAENVWFGAILSPINPAYARNNNLPRSALWLVKVFDDTGAGRAGLRSGDLLIELNGSPLRLSGGRVYQYFQQALRPREGAPFRAVVLRDGKRVEVGDTLDKRPEPATLRAEDLGITVSDINQAMVVRLNLAEEKGVLITEVTPGSAAATGRQFGSSLLQQRDVITAIGGHPTPSIAAFGEALDQIRREKPSALLIEFRRGPVTGIEALNLRIGERKNGTPL